MPLDELCIVAFGQSSPPSTFNAPSRTGISTAKESWGSCDYIYSETCKADMRTLPGNDVELCPDQPTVILELVLPRVFVLRVPLARTPTVVGIPKFPRPRRLRPRLRPRLRCRIRPCLQVISTIVGRYHSPQRFIAGDELRELHRSLHLYVLVEFPAAVRFVPL